MNSESLWVYVDNAPGICQAYLEANPDPFKEVKEGFLIIDSQKYWRIVLFKGQEPLIVFGDFLNKDLTIGWSTALKTQVVFHKHSAEDPKWDDEPFENVKHVAKKFFSVEIPPDRIDVMTLPPLASFFKSSFTCDKDKLFQSVDVLYHLALTLLGISERGYVLPKDCVFTKDISENRIYLLQSNLVKGESARNMRFLREEIQKIFPSFPEIDDADLIECLRYRYKDRFCRQLTMPYQGNPSFFIGKRIETLDGEKAELVRLNSIGKGVYKGVYKGVLKKGTVYTPVAIGCMSPRVPKKLKECEIEALMRARSKTCVIDTLAVVRMGDWVEIVMPLYQTDLLQASCLTTMLNRKERVEALRQSVLGLKHLHEADMICSDFKPANILVRFLPDSALEVALTDFGGVVDKKNGEYISSDVYMSPEIARRYLQQEAEITQKSDSWLVASAILEVLWHMFIVNDEVHKNYRTEFDRWIAMATTAGDFILPSPLAPVVRRGFSLDPENRPTDDEYLNALTTMREEL